jgi:hypothetical protein
MYEDNEEIVASVVINDKRHEFVFRPGCDDPSEGATLTGVYNVSTGQRLKPSTHAESEAWVVAHEQMGIA